MCSVSPDVAEGDRTGGAGGGPDRERASDENSEEKLGNPFRGKTNDNDETKRWKK